MASDTTTNGIRIQVATIFLDEYSRPAENHFLFSYRVKITNAGNTRAKLDTRYWLIIDSDGQEEEVRGPGVVGKHPDLAPGGDFQYFSFCHLRTPFGTMEGSFRMIPGAGEAFDAVVGRFFLDTGLAEFPANAFKRGQLVRHNLYKYVGLVVDYDICFLGDDDWYERNPAHPPRDIPWYHVLVGNSDKITYVAQDNISAADPEAEFSHPLVDFFFDTNSRQAGRYARNQRTWADLKNG